jgi:hypothetical protein
VANELQCTFDSGKTVYFLIRSATATIWSTVANSLVTYATADYTNYDIAATEQGTASGYYTGDFPSAAAPGVYSIVAKQQLGGSPAESDPTIAQGSEQWNGSNLLPLSDLATSGQIGQLAPIRLARGTQIQNFLFDLVSSADHITPFVSGVISGQICRDNGSFGALQSGAFTEVGNGFYRLQSFTSGDLLANTAAVIFTGVGISGGNADPRKFTFVLQRTSGQ